jgi:peptidoglycan/xylan/chitin deacetylase (PgdA/CDA1 family)
LKHRDTLVLCYHAVSDGWPELIALDAERLETQVTRLLTAGWRATTFTEAVLAPPAQRTLAITFDDGFRSVPRLAAPILRRLGVPATLFVATAFPGSGHPLAWPHLDRWVGTRYEHELEPSGWAELAGLRDAGWEIGSHTVTHPRLTELPSEQLERELHDSRAEIERRLGGSCRSVSYPYGAVDARVAQVAKATGFLAGAALLPTPRARDALRFPRVLISAQESEPVHRLHLRRSVRWLQGTRPWPRVQRSLRSLRGTHAS